MQRGDPPEASKRVIDTADFDQWVNVPDSDLQVMIRSSDPIGVLWVRVNLGKKPRRGRPPKERNAE